MFIFGPVHIQVIILALIVHVHSSPSSELIKTLTSVQHDGVTTQSTGVTVKNQRSLPIIKNVSHVKSQYVHRSRTPPKRDFQDHNPPQTPEELYKRYDPSTTVSTGVMLGGLLGFLVGRVVVRQAGRLIRRRLRKTKRFAKYFPERELPPLHIAQQIAREHGVVLPESLINKLVRSGSQANLRMIADAVKSPAAVTTAAISPLILQQQSTESGQTPNAPLLTTSPSASELLGLIRVNIIGATPSITPNASHKLLPNLQESQENKNTQDQNSSGKIQRKSSQRTEKTSPMTKGDSQSLRNENGHANAKSNNQENMNNILVVTTAVIETQPLLLSTTTSTMSAMSCGDKSPSSTTSVNSDQKNTSHMITGIGDPQQIPSVHKSMADKRPVSTSSYCLSNGDALLTPGTSRNGERRYMEA